MADKYRAVMCILSVFVMAVIYPGPGQSRAESVNVNVFEQFRLEMANDYNAAARSFMTPEALTKWNAHIAPRFNVKSRQINHFFATSMMIPKLKGGGLFVLFFNPWVDGAFVTRWMKIDNSLKITNFHMASGERIRGLASPGAAITPGHLPPIWLWQKGTLLESIFKYYTDMRARLLAIPVEECMSWFSLGQREADLDLLRVKLRMEARQKTTDAYIKTGTGGPALTGAYAKLKYDALTGNTRSLSAYSADSEIIAKLKPEIIKGLEANWIFYQKGIYTTLLSSAIAPRYFIFMSSTDTGKIKGVLFLNLEIVATLKPATATSMPREDSEVTTKKVLVYKDTNGDQIEITTEKRGNTVTMTTRRNGKVTEVLNF